MSERTIVNPNTGRFCRFNGPTHRKLMSDGTLPNIVTVKRKARRKNPKKTSGVYEIPEDIAEKLETLKMLREKYDFSDSEEEEIPKKKFTRMRRKR